MFGLFSRASSKQEEAKLEDVTVTLRQKKRELHEVEKLISELRRKADIAASLDEHIAKQQMLLDELEKEARHKLKEFSRAEKEFESQEKTFLDAEKASLEQQAIIEEKRKLLSAKEEALREREGLVVDRFDQAERLEFALKRSEIPLERRRNRLAVQIASLDQELQKKRAEGAATRRELAHQHQQLRMITVQAGKAADMKKEIEQMRRRFDERAAKLNEKERSISQREKEFNLKQAQLLEQIQALEEAKHVAERAMNAKAEAEKAIKETQRYAEQARSMLAENNQKIGELNAVQVKLAESQGDLDKQQKEVDEKLATIQQKEKVVTQKELLWLDHQNELKNLADGLATSKQEIETFAAERKGELANLQQEWDDKITALRDEKEFLSTQKVEIDRLVRDDIGMLKDKEQEMLGMIKEFNKDQAMLEKEERAVVSRVRLLERDQQKLEHAKRELTDAKKIIAAAEKAKALKKQLPGLSRTAAQLKRTITQLERKGKKFGVRVVHVTHAAAAPKPMVVRAERIERPAKAGVARKPAIALPAVSGARDELQSMIESARSSIDSGNIDEAKRLLDGLEAAARKLSEEDRRQLSYEIKDLRTSIKLATLA